MKKLFDLNHEVIEMVVKAYHFDVALGYICQVLEIALDEDDFYEIAEIEEMMS